MKLHTFADAVTAIDDRYIAEAAEAEAVQTKHKTRYTRCGVWIPARLTWSAIEATVQSKALL